MEFTIWPKAFGADEEVPDLTNKLTPAKPVVKLLSTLCAVVLAAVMAGMTGGNSFEVVRSEHPVQSSIVVVFTVDPRQVEAGSPAISSEGDIR